jgi:transposase
MAAKQQKTTYTAAEVAVLENKIQEQQAQIEELKRKLEHMNEVFANAQRARFGQSSEQKSYVLGKDQLSLFNEAEEAQDHKAEEPTSDTVLIAAHERKKKRSQAEMLNQLPEEEVLLEIPEEQLVCGKCGGKMKPIGKKFLRHEMQIIPKQVKLLAYYAVTYACDSCEKDTGFAHITSVKPPVPLMKHSLASPSTVAYIMTQKYVDGLPLARQVKIWAREGISLSRATMANWVIQCSQSWLKPLYKHMKQELLTHSVIHADETVVQVLKEEGKPATSESRMWLYASAALLRHQVRIFEYQPDRSGKRPESFLRGFAGCLVTDGYAGYNQVQNVTHCGCWAHARRKWREAMPEGATVKTSKAAVGFQYCNKLFAEERKCAPNHPKYRQEYRQNRELPLLEEYYAWLNTVHPEKGSKLEEAVRYSLNQKQCLMAYLDHGEVPISNNLAENAIRPFTLGRKNWLFCDTPKGAEASAIVYSLVESAKANGVEPFAYLQHVLVQLPYLGKTHSHEELETLMPWAPYIQQNFAMKNSNAYTNCYLD